MVNYGKYSDFPLFRYRFFCIFWNLGDPNFIRFLSKTLLVKNMQICHHSLRSCRNRSQVKKAMKEQQKMEHAWFQLCVFTWAQQKYPIACAEVDSFHSNFFHFIHQSPSCFRTRPHSNLFFYIGKAYKSRGSACFILLFL